MKVLTVSRGTLVVLAILLVVTVITAVICFFAGEDNVEVEPPKVEIVLPKGGEK